MYACELCEYCLPIGGNYYKSVVFEWICRYGKVLLLEGVGERTMMVGPVIISSRLMGQRVSKLIMLGVACHCRLTYRRGQATH